MLVVFPRSRLGLLHDNDKRLLFEMPHPPVYELKGKLHQLHHHFLRLTDLANGLIIADAHLLFLYFFITL